MAPALQMIDCLPSGCLETATITELILSGVAQTGGDAVDALQHGGFDIFVVRRVGIGAQAAQQFDLHVAQRIDIRVAAGDRAFQDLAVVEQGFDLGDLADQSAGALMLGGDGSVERVAKRFVGRKVGIQARDVHVGLGQNHLRVVDQRREEGPAPVHLLKQRHALFG